MNCDHVITELRKLLSHAFKHEQVALLFTFPPGHELHQLFHAKARATEATIRGMDVMLRGGSSELVMAGFNDMIQALDNLSTRMSPKQQALVFEERAFLITLREKMKRLEEIVSTHEGDEPESSVDPQFLN